MPSRSDYEGYLEDLLADDSDSMTEWEVEFIESMNKRGGYWSEKQVQCLMKIWEKVCGD